MEWFANLAAKWQRVVIAVVVVLMLVGIEVLREMVRTEEGRPEKQQKTEVRQSRKPALQG